MALFLQPAAQSSHASTLGDVVDFAYPLGDAIIVGATLGVMALMGWRPGRMWMLLGVGFAALGVADAIYSVNALGYSYSSETTFDALWLAGMALIAYAAWLPHPGQLEPVSVTGWRAIALPVAAQCLALALQVYALFYEVPRSERIFTIVVLIIATVQIIVTRPRPTRAPTDNHGQPRNPRGDTLTSTSRSTANFAGCSLLPYTSNRSPGNPRRGRRRSQRVPRGTRAPPARSLTAARILTPTADR